MKILYIKHRSGKRMNNFAISAILAAKEIGADFTIANNMNGADKEHFKEVCDKFGIKMIHIDFDRNPASFNNVIASRQLKKLMEKERYDIVHCNTPTGGIVGRICAKVTHVPYVIYQAHGFHFWEGAPLKNWMLYYTVEAILARLSDVVVTINKEDFQLAKKFSYRKGNDGARYVPGVGVEIEKIKNIKSQIDYESKRKELGIPKDAFVIVSVGELNENKNHSTAIKAFKEANIKNSYYLVCGTGKLKEELEELIKKSGLEKQVKLLGYRTDIYEILAVSDLFLFPSKREGLSVALMEAMAMEILCAASAIRGNVDLLEGSKLLFNPNSVTEIKECICKASKSNIVKMEISKNSKTLEKYDMEKAVKAMKKIYLEASNKITS